MSDFLAIIICSLIVLATGVFIGWLIWEDANCPGWGPGLVGESFCRLARGHDGEHFCYPPSAVRVTETLTSSEESP